MRCCSEWIIDGKGRDIKSHKRGANQKKKEN
jgi:hypothetical protein